MSDLEAEKGHLLQYIEAERVPKPEVERRKSLLEVRMMRAKRSNFRRYIIRMKTVRKLVQKYPIAAMNRRPHISQIKSSFQNPTASHDGNAFQVEETRDGSGFEQKSNPLIMNEISPEVANERKAFGDQDSKMDGQPIQPIENQVSDEPQASNQQSEMDSEPTRPLDTRVSNESQALDDERFKMDTEPAHSSEHQTSNDSGDLADEDSEMDSAPTQPEADKSRRPETPVQHTTNEQDDEPMDDVDKSVSPGSSHASHMDTSDSGVAQGEGRGDPKAPPASVQGESEQLKSTRQELNNSLRDSQPPNEGSQNKKFLLLKGKGRGKIIVPFDETLQDQTEEKVAPSQNNLTAAKAQGTQSEFPVKQTPQQSTDQGGSDLGFFLERVKANAKMPLLEKDLRNRSEKHKAEEQKAQQNPQSAHNQEAHPSRTFSTGQEPDLTSEPTLPGLLSGEQMTNNSSAADEGHMNNAPDPSGQGVDWLSEDNPVHDRMMEEYRGDDDFLPPGLERM